MLQKDEGFRIQAILFFISFLMTPNAECLFFTEVTH